MDSIHQKFLKRKRHNDNKIEFILRGGLMGNSGIICRKANKNVLFRGFICNNLISKTSSIIIIYCQGVMYYGFIQMFYCNFEK